MTVSVPPPGQPASAFIGWPPPDAPTGCDDLAHLTGGAWQAFRPQASARQSRRVAGGPSRQHRRSRGRFRRVKRLRAPAVSGRWGPAPGHARRGCLCVAGFCTSHDAALLAANGAAPNRPARAIAFAHPPTPKRTSPMPRSGSSGASPAARSLCPNLSARTSAVSAGIQPAPLRRQRALVAGVLVSPAIGDERG